MNESGRISYSDLQGGLGNGCGPSLMMYILLACLIITLLTSCRTVKQAETTTEKKTEVRNDSSNVSAVHVDTANVEHSKHEKEREKTSTESNVEKKDSFVTVVDQNGNVVGTKEYHWLKETLREVSERERILKDSLSMYRHISDSLSYYRGKLDSLSHLSNYEKTIEVEKKLSMWQQFKVDYGGYSIGTSFFLVMLIITRLLRKQTFRV